MSVRRHQQKLEHELHPRLDKAVAWIGVMVGRARIVVLIAVAAVLLVALSLFVLGGIQSLISIGNAWASLLDGDLKSVELTVSFLEIITVMLKAVFFYLIGVGLFSLFIAPLNVAIALGIQTLMDLEIKILNVVIVIMAVTFLEHFTRWRDPWQTLQFAASFALAVAVIVMFELFSHYSSAENEEHDPASQQRSKRELFEQDKEQHEVKEPEPEEPDDPA